MSKLVNVIMNRQILIIIVYHLVSSSFFIALMTPTRALGKITDAIKDVQNKNAAIAISLSIKIRV